MNTYSGSSGEPTIVWFPSQACVFHCGCRKAHSSNQQRLKSGGGVSGSWGWGKAKKNYRILFMEVSALCYSKLRVGRRGCSLKDWPGTHQKSREGSIFHVHSFLHWVIPQSIWRPPRWTPGVFTFCSSLVSPTFLVSFHPYLFPLYPHPMLEEWGHIFRFRIAVKF